MNKDDLIFIILTYNEILFNLTRRKDFKNCTFPDPELCKIYCDNKWLCKRLFEIEKRIIGGKDV